MKQGLGGDIAAQAPLSRARIADGSAGPTTLALAGQLVRFAFPSTLVMVLSAMSLLVDTYFVTGLGSEALAGASLVLPIYFLVVMAFGGGIGVGLSVVLSVRLGRGDATGAQRAIGSAFALALGLAFAFAVAFAVGGRALFLGITSPGPVLEAAMSFGRPIFLGTPVIALCLTISNILRSEKRLGEAAVMLLVSSAVNAALNPILIHGHFGAPAMGVAGAGLATVIGFLVSAVLGGVFLRRGRLSLGALRIDRSDMWDIARIALPTLGGYVATKSVSMALSVIWLGFGTDALAAFGLTARLEYLLAIVIYGMGSAILTLGGEARGAGRYRELARICWVAAGCVVIGTGALAVALVAAPGAWFQAFGASPEVVDRGVSYLRIVALSYPLYALALTLNYGYQTLARAHLPLIWSVTRGFGVAVPVAALVAATSESIATASVGVAASFVLWGTVTALWLPRTLARVTRADRPC